MSNRRYNGIVALSFMLLAFAGCRGNEAEFDNLSRTERARLLLTPEASSFIVSSEQALLGGNYNLAFAYTDSIEALTPELADIPFMRGRIHKKLNLLESSDQEFSRVIELDPDYKGARYNLGVNALQRGMLREAIDYFKEEEQINAESIVYLELGKAYARLGEPDSAQAAYEKAIEGDPENANAYMWFGQLYEELGDLDNALTYSHKGLEIKPEDPNYKYILGSQYLRKGENDKAVEFLEPVAQQLPWHQGAQYSLGQALMRLGQDDQAQKYLQQADAAQQMQQALNEAQDAVNTDPDNRDAWVHKSNLLWQQGEQMDAIDAYMIAVSIDPGNFAMQTNLSSMLIESGNTGAGIERLKSVLRNKLDFVPAWNNLGAALASVGSYAEARDAWGNALMHDPGNAQAKDFLKQLDAMGK